MFLSTAFAQAGGFDPNDCFVVSKFQETKELVRFQMFGGFKMSTFTGTMSKEEVLNLIQDLSGFPKARFTLQREMLDCTPGNNTPPGIFLNASVTEDLIHAAEQPDADAKIEEFKKSYMKQIADFAAKHPQASFSCEGLDLLQNGSVNGGN
jgi:hypothetical protein